MNKTIRVWSLIEESIKEKIPVMLLYVLESKGSSPGRRGFLMAVNAIGQMEGSIGGGIMEHKFVEMAKARLGDGQVEKGMLRKQVHDKSAAKNQSGMICSGEQTVWLYPVKESELEIIQNLLGSLRSNKAGTLRLSTDGIQFFNETPAQDFDFVMDAEEQWHYQEKIGFKNTIYIIGGGHCSLALSRLMHGLDFYIHVFEERKELPTLLENEWANEIDYVDDYAELRKKIPSGENNYIVIMTMGYRTDEIALNALLETNAKYIGLLGSGFKTAKMMEDFTKKGINENWLSKVHAPIGINISSQTPEEIAVSIAAEIIRVKNRKED